jgi:hypothetical protein
MPQGAPDDDQPDLVDEHFRPFVRALGNLVITFALCEASLLELVSEMFGGDELKAVTVLKAKCNCRSIQSHPPSFVRSLKPSI